jgi:hypothetical protein
MKYSLVVLLTLIQYLTCFAQDGGNMNYLKPNEINKSYIGRKLHIDFYRKSFAHFLDKTRDLDTVKIKVNGKKTNFKEHRVDDGYNNWFSQQYLESIEKTDNLKLRIEKFELLKFDDADIFVKAFFIFVNDDGKVLSEKLFTRKLTFPKKDIVELLFEVKN